MQQNEYDFNIKNIGLVVERLPNPNWRIDNLVNNDYHILGCAIGGEAFYTLDNVQYTVKKGDILFFPKGFPHTAFNSKTNPWHFYSISFDVEFGNKWSEEGFLSFAHIISSPTTYRIPALISELNNIWMGKRPGYMVKSKSLMLDILYVLVKEKESSSWNTSHYADIEKIANMIQVNHKNDYTVEDLSKLTKLSPSHFRLLFKKITGFTTVQYQNHVRINKARDLLLNGDCNVTEAALTVGFNDIYYFSRLFKKLTGMNPSDYIKS